MLKTWLAIINRHTRRTMFKKWLKGTWPTLLSRRRVQPFFFISWLLHALCGFLQTIKQLDSEGSSDDEAKEKLLRNALSEGRKLNDQAGGSKEKQEAILIEVLQIVVQIVRDTEGNVYVGIVALKETILGVSQF